MPPKKAKKTIANYFPSPASSGNAQNAADTQDDPSGSDTSDHDAQSQASQQSQTGDVSLESAKKDEEKQKRRRRRKNNTDYKAYIHKVNKQVNPDGSISKSAMQVMNDLIKDLEGRISEEAASLCKKSKRSVLRAIDIQAAVKLIMAGGLMEHALDQGNKALATTRAKTEKKII